MNVLTGFILVMALMLPFSKTVLAADSGKAKTPIVVDVRTQAEWDAGHLEGAVLIPFERIAAEASQIASDKTIKMYLYCRTGRRSALALDALKKNGYTDVINLGSIESAAKALDKKILK